jgi:TatD DNase family protein
MFYEKLMTPSKCMPGSYFDAHNHLQKFVLTSQWTQASQWEEVIDICKSLPVTRMIVNGTTEADWEIVDQLSKQWTAIIPSYGLHPWYISQRSPNWLEHLKSRLLQTNALMGEIGLDRWVQPHDFEDQIAVFKAQLELAHQLNRPVTIHCLRAWGALLEILGATKIPTTGFLLHAYGGPIEMVKPFVKLGAYFSFSGYFLHPGKESKLETFRQIPQDRLLVETDAPSMAMPNEFAEFRVKPSAVEKESEMESGDKINHPGNLRAIYRALAKIRDIPESDLIKIVKTNFYRAFMMESDSE